MLPRGPYPEQAEPLHPQRLTAGSVTIELGTTPDPMTLPPSVFEISEIMPCKENPKAVQFLEI